MYRYDLIENSPRDKIKKVEEQLPAVMWATAWVVADTVGGDKAAIRDAWDREALGEATGLQPRDFFPDDDKVHKNEKLIRWVAEKISPKAYEVGKERQTPEQFLDFCVKLEAALPQIAYWVEKTKPNLFQLSASQAIGLASDMEVEDNFPVPQGEVIYRFPDGWTVQELKTPEQVYAEGEVMQHCMRESQNGPRFCKQISRGDTRLFSLRNPQGRPGVSMEYDTEGKRFVQIFAKQNTPLGVSLPSLIDEKIKNPEGLWRGIQKYKKYVAKFINEKFGGNAEALVMVDAPLPDGLKSVKDELRLYGYNQPLPDGLTSVEGSLWLGGYNHPLPDGLKIVGGYLSLGGYNHPLPAGLKSVGIFLSLDGYNHPLPAGLKSVGNLDLRGYDHPLPAGLKIVGYLSLGDYNYPLPAGLTSVGGSLNLKRYEHPLPAGLTSVEGDLYLRDYNHPLPAGLKSVGDYLSLDGYKHPLPAGLKSVGGYLWLGGYNHPLPDGLTSVEGDLNLRGYDHPLPAGLTSVGGSLWLSFYNHPLPAGLTSVGGDLNLYDYNHPLPAGLRVKGKIIGAENYPYGIPGRRPALKPNRRRTSRPSKSRRKTSRSKRKTSRS